VNNPFDDDEQLTSLAPETRRQRQAALLRPLNTTLLAISALGLLLMVTVYYGRSSLASYLVVCSSLSIFAIVAVLERSGPLRWAAHLLCFSVNLGVILIITENLFLSQDLQTGLLFSLELALSIMLAGFLLSSGTMFVYAGADIVAVFLFFWRFFTLYPEQNIADLGAPALGKAVPVSAFLIMISLVSWLHQRALSKADGQLEVAHRRMMKDQRIRHDLAVARSIQQQLFAPPPAMGPHLQIVAHAHSARETSGDFYDFINLGDDRVGIVVADVTSKSVGAALLMGLGRATIRAEARRHALPAMVLRGANTTICQDYVTRQMITALYGVLDTRTLLLRFSNAGHLYPILRRDGLLHELELDGLPLGGLPDADYGERSLSLEPGDQLFLLSDGLTEERNTQGEIFGYERLYAAILAADPADPEQADEALWQAATSFRGAAAQADDITIVVLQVLPVAQMRADSTAQGLPEGVGSPQIMSG
jgi:Stage II sporulation protein E (SpoIIE)